MNLMTMNVMTASAVSAVAVFGTAASASYFTRPEGPWYDCVRPSASPPNYVFPIAWTTLYVLIAISLARMLARPEKPLVLAVFALNLVLNALWCYAYFAAQRPTAALAVILALVAATAYLIACAADRAAAWLLVPYLAWICFATFLNAQSALKEKACAKLVSPL